MNTRSLIPLIVALVLLLVSGGLYGYGYYTLVHSNEKIAELSARIDSKSIELEKDNRAQATLAALRSDTSLINQYSIARNDIPSFLETLQSTGKPFGTKVQVLSVVDAPPGTHPRILLALSISGSFDAVMRTLGVMEYSPYDGVVNAVSLDATSQNASSTSWIANTTYSVGVRVASSTQAKP